jgi:hypothetical protein
LIGHAYSFALAPANPFAAATMSSVSNFHDKVSSYVSEISFLDGLIAWGCSPVNVNL